MRSAAFAFPVTAPSGRPLPVWRADRICAPAVHGGDPADAARPTGHAALDAELPGGGWPVAGLIELLLATPGCGELRLLAPALAPLPLLWVAPPFVPYVPALAVLGLAPARLTVATPDDAADAAWAAEQALRSGALGAVLWWQGQTRAATLPATLRRLHLAAEEGRTPLFALRPAAARAQSSPAPLRLALEAVGPSRLAVEVFKRRGPPMGTPLVLRLPGLALRGERRAASHARTLVRREDHAVVCLAPERVAA